MCQAFPGTFFIKGVIYIKRFIITVCLFCFILSISVVGYATDFTEPTEPATITDVNNNIIGFYTYFRDIFFPNIRDNIINIYTLLRSKLDTLNNNIIAIYTTIRDRIVDNIASISANIKALLNSSNSISDAVNSSPTPSSPAFNESFNEANRVETEIIGSTSTGKDDATAIIGEAQGLISTYLGAFTGVSFLLTSFLNISYINHLFVFSLSLGIFALITNLGLQAFGKERNKGKAQKSNGKKGG